MGGDFMSLSFCSLIIIIMKNKNFIFWTLQIIFDISILIVLMWHNCFNKYANRRAYCVYTETYTYKIMDKPEQTYNYLDAEDNIKTIYVKYKDDKIVCEIIGWNDKRLVLSLNRSEHVVVDYL